MEKNINRRDFLKLSGATLGAAALAGCQPKPAVTSGNPADGAPAGEMEYRINPGNGDKVSLLGYGCMRWPQKPGPDGKDLIDQEKVNELVDYAIDHGVNYFDTSPAYLGGESERASAIALNRHPRKDFFWATKLSNFQDASREASLRMYRDSFEQLQTDFIDYYLLHAIGRGGNRAFEMRYVENGMMDFLLKEREKGAIRQLGFSFHGNQKALDELLALHGKYHWDFVQIQMNYMDWRHADGVRNVHAEYAYEQLDKLGIPITIMEPLQGGRLANVPDIVADKLKERDPGRTVSSWAFRFAGSFPRILTVLSGMTYMDHLTDNVATYSGFRPLGEEDLAFLEQMASLMKVFPTVDCNDCKYCMPCPYGVDIPGIFVHYNKCKNEGILPREVGDADYRTHRRNFLISLDRSVPRNRQADHCIGCGQCEPHCPQRIRIPRELQKLDHMIEELKRNA
jgi:predicted aldo/keto reductase-like oxidoreductase